MATKTSILLFYLSLANNQIIFKRCTIATLIVVILAGLALTLLNVLQCQPVWAVFSEEVPKDAVCTDLVTLYLSSSPVNTITDLAMLFLPMPILTSMRLPRKQKIILVVTFSFGAFVAAVDVVRIYYLQQAFQVRLEEVGRDNATTSSRVLERDDFSWYASLSFMWSAIEVCSELASFHFRRGDLSKVGSRRDYLRLRTQPQAFGCEDHAEYSARYQ